MVAWDVCPGEETIAAYVAGQLPRDERDGVDSHLDTCSACQELVAALAKLQPPRESAAAAPDDTELAGTLGRYVLHARLGAGGMGVVYAAYDPELDRRVALKVLRRTRAGEQLREEARAIAKLAHPNVIAVHDVGEADGEVFVAMEHVDGVTVREWLREKRTASAILDVFVQAGRGLAAAHRAGLVHRDVKPSNIIVGNDGRARVLDFGLARSDQAGELDVAGTPAYMAPEQQRGERVDARADQYAFSVALWEALGGSRSAQKLDGVGERVVRALLRGRADDPAERFATMDELLDELAPPPARARRWMIAAAIGMLAIGAAVAVVVLRQSKPESCARAGAPVARVWNVEIGETLRAAFVATKLPYAAKAAGITISELDDWAMRWQDRAVSTCKATVEERFQPPAARALVDDCLAQLLDRARAVIALAKKPDAQVVANADTLVRSLPSPDRCFVGELSAVAPPPERDRAEVHALRAEISALDVALLAGRVQQVRDRVLVIDKRAGELGYVPLRARAQLLVARLESSSAHYDQAIAHYHAAARDATTARDRSLLAEIWIELSQTLGNDVGKQSEAEVFDGYAAALIPQLADTKTYELDLAFARCNRNVTAADAAKIAEHCKTAFAMAWETVPPKRAIAIAARTRLGHFLRLQGQQAEAISTLRDVIASAAEFHGPQHPDVAIAHYALGIALISQDSFDEGIAELRAALDIRRAAFPGNTVQVAESLSGLGDALASAGKHADALPYLEQALAMLAAANQPHGMHAAQTHILLGMSLEELGRAPEALPHYIEAADIADRHLPHREAIAAMALRLAANTQIDHPEVGVPHLERAIRLLERGKASPADLGQTQFRLAQFLAEIPRERSRARALAEAARASFATVHADAQVAEVDAFVRGIK